MIAKLAATQQVLDILHTATQNRYRLVNCTHL